jgi:hypothetical protein
MVIVEIVLFSPAWTPQYIRGALSTTQEPEKKAASSPFCWGDRVRGEELLTRPKYSCIKNCNIECKSK